MTEIRYDGPDLESDTSGRTQGLLMAAVMAADGVHAGRQVADQRTDQHTQHQQAAADQADRALWAGVPAADLPGLDDAALATRWQAAARHHGDRDADTARAALERELTDRDPDTMRDYRSWRYAAGADPGAAMRNALREREVRLAEAWRPLADGRADQLDQEQLAAGWVAAISAHDPRAASAAATGEQLIRDQIPELMGRYDAARAQLTPTPGGQRVPGLVPPLAAAGQATGARTAFGPGTRWAQVLHDGVPTPAPHHPITASPRPATAGTHHRGHLAGLLAGPHDRPPAR